MGTTTVVSKMCIEGVQLMSADFTVMSVQLHVSVMSFCGDALTCSVLVVYGMLVHCLDVVVLRRA